MYLIKNIAVNNMEHRVYIDDYVEVYKLSNSRLECEPSYWGGILLNSGAFPRNSPSCTKISCCQSYMTKNIGDNFIDLCLFDSKNEFSIQDVKDEEDYVGYIIFIRKSLEPIKTNGNVLYERYGTEMIVILSEDGQFLEIDGFKFEYQNKKVFYKTYI